MNCQYCGKIFRRDYNLRRHEDENVVQTEAMKASHPSPMMMKMRIPKMKAVRSENSSDEKNDPWHTLINEAVPKVWDQYKEILQDPLMEGHDESKAKEDAFAQILPAFRKELGDVHMDNLTWMTVILEIL